MEGRKKRRLAEERARAARREVIARRVAAVLRTPDKYRELRARLSIPRRFWMLYHPRVLRKVHAKFRDNNPFIHPGRKLTRKLARAIRCKEGRDARRHQAFRARGRGKGIGPPRRKHRC